MTTEEIMKDSIHEARTEVVQATVPPSLMAATKAAALHDYCSVSDLVRRLLSSHCRALGIDPIAFQERAASDVR